MEVSPLMEIMLLKPINGEKVGKRQLQLQNYQVYLGTENRMDYFL